MIKGDVLSHGQFAARGVAATRDACEALVREILALDRGGHSVLATKLEIDVAALEARHPIIRQGADADVDLRRLLLENGREARKHEELEVVSCRDPEDASARSRVERLRAAEDSFEARDGVGHGLHEGFRALR